MSVVSVSLSDVSWMMILRLTGGIGCASSTSNNGSDADLPLFISIVG